MSEAINTLLSLRNPDTSRTLWVPIETIQVDGRTWVRFLDSNGVCNFDDHVASAGQMALPYCSGSTGMYDAHALLPDENQAPKLAHVMARAKLKALKDAAAAAALDAQLRQAEIAAMEKELNSLDD